MNKKYNINEQIESLKINLILTNGNIREGISLTEALEIAQQEELDVVEVSNKGAGGLPVCKILDHGKWMYQQQKKSKKQIVHKKEIKYGYNISQHDLDTKHNKIFTFLKKKYIVTYVLELKGRERHKIEEATNRFKKEIQNFELVAMWKDIRVSQSNRGATISAVLNPIKKD
jgi:translation initiation factor IF-3